MVHYAPRIEKVFRKNKKRTGLRWRMDETYLKIKGEWKYLYRAVDKQGDTGDFLLTSRRDKKAARRFLNKALAGIELWRVLKKGQNKNSLPAWEQFYALALTGWLRLIAAVNLHESKNATEPY